MRNDISQRGGANDKSLNECQLALKKDENDFEILKAQFTKLRNQIKLKKQIILQLKKQLQSKPGPRRRRRKRIFELDALKEIVFDRKEVTKQLVSVSESVTPFFMLWLIKEHTNDCTPVTANGIPIQLKWRCYKGKHVLFDNFDQSMEYFKHFFMKQCFSSKARFIFVDLSLSCEDCSWCTDNYCQTCNNLGHANFLMYDRELNEIEHFEPHGGRKLYLEFRREEWFGKPELETKLTELFKSIRGVNGRPITYIRASQFCPMKAFQSMQENKEAAYAERGTCKIWSNWYVHFRMSNPSYDRKTLLRMADAEMKKGGFAKFILRYAKDLRNFVGKITTGFIEDLKLLKKEDLRPKKTRVGDILLIERHRKHVIGQVINVRSSSNVLFFDIKVHGEKKKITLKTYNVDEIYAEDAPFQNITSHLSDFVHVEIKKEMNKEFGKRIDSYKQATSAGLIKKIKEKIQNFPDKINLMFIHKKELVLMYESAGNPILSQILMITTPESSIQLSQGSMYKVILRHNMYIFDYPMLKRRQDIDIIPLNIIVNKGLTVQELEKLQKDTFMELPDKYKYERVERRNEDEIELVKQYVPKRILDTYDKHGSLEDIPQVLWVGLVSMAKFNKRLG